MLDLKALNAALEQLESERGIEREKIIDAIEQALATAYKKEYGKRGQIVRARFSTDAGTTAFEQVKEVVDETLVRTPEEREDERAREIEKAEEKSIGAGVKLTARSSEETGVEPEDGRDDTEDGEKDERVNFNPEHHIFIEDARKIKRDVALGDEIVFPLEPKEDFGRIAAQTAKQVVIQKLREAERESVLGEFSGKQGEIVSGTVQRIERGNIFIDLGRTVGLLAREEQIPGERYRQGERVRAYLYAVDDSPRGVYLRLSRTHPQFLKRLFEIESPEIASGTVEVKTIAREPGSRSKIAVASSDAHVDPVGSLVGQRGVRVSTVTSELGGEKIDIIEWSEDPAEFIEDALSPARVLEVALDEQDHRATATVAPEQQSLAIGKGGQNVRLAAKLTGWKIDIRSAQGAESEDKETDASIENTAAASEESLEEMQNEKIKDQNDNEKIPNDTPEK
ncbi:MAG: transcription termination factor NusA [bacterium]|nr:transcription termination factor NusA [bacterium]MDZ4284893.1 transcription termination factor NusA [Patescibacteria group bacterium]